MAYLSRSRDPDIRARRQEQLQRAESTFNPLPLDVSVARAYGRIVGAVVAAKRKHRGAPSLDLLIAATPLQTSYRFTLETLMTSLVSKR